MIRSFGDRLTQDIYHGRETRAVKRVPLDLRRRVTRKLDMMEAAHRLEDLRSPPGNRLEALAGDLKGFHSIRVTDQWRLVFKWEQGAAERVRLTDYH